VLVQGWRLNGKTGTIIISAAHLHVGVCDMVGNHMRWHEWCSEGWCRGLYLIQMRTRMRAGNDIAHVVAEVDISKKKLVLFLLIPFLPPK